MATTIDKHYASEDEKRPFVSDDQTFNSQYERMPGAKSSISETIEPFTESQVLRDPRTVKYVNHIGGRISNQTVSVIITM